MFVNKLFAYEIFDIFSYQDKNIGRFSNLHYCSFNVSPDLKTGVACSIFILSERVPLLKDKSKMHFNGTNKVLKFCFTISYFISSKPGLLPPFKEKNAFISSSGKVTSSGKVISQRILAIEVFHMLVSV